MAYSDAVLADMARQNNLPSGLVLVRTTSGGAVWILPDRQDIIDLYRSGALTGGITESAPGGVYLRVLPDETAPTLPDNTVVPTPTSAPVQYQFSDAYLAQQAIQNNLPAGLVLVRTTSGGAVWILPDRQDIIDLYRSGALTGDITESAPGGVYLRLLPDNVNTDTTTPTPPYQPPTTQPLPPVPPPPTTTPTTPPPASPIDLRNTVQISSYVIDREYVKDSMVQLSPQKLLFKNITTNLNLNLGIRGVPGVVFTPSVFQLPATETKEITVSFIMSEINKLAEGLTSIISVVDVTSDTVFIQDPATLPTLPPVAPVPVIPSVLPPPPPITPIALEPTDPTSPPPIDPIPKVKPRIPSDDPSSGPIDGTAWIFGPTGETRSGSPPSDYFLRDGAWWPPLVPIDPGTIPFTPIPVSPTPTPIPTTPPVNTAWVSGVSGYGYTEGTYYFSAIPDGWVQDPYGGTWFPPNDPFVLSGWGRSGTSGQLPTPLAQWVDGTTSQINYGLPPSDWVQDPVGMAWYPATHPFVLSGFGRDRTGTTRGTTTYIPPDETTTSAPTGNTSWIDGRTGTTYLGDPPKGWVRDPATGTWWAGNDPYITNGFGPTIDPSTLIF